MESLLSDNWWIVAIGLLLVLWFYHSICRIIYRAARTSRSAWVRFLETLRAYLANEEPSFKKPVHS